MINHIDDLIKLIAEIRDNKQDKEFSLPTEELGDLGDLSEYSWKEIAPSFFGLKEHAQILGGLSGSLAEEITRFQILVHYELDGKMSYKKVSEDEVAVRVAFKKKAP